MNSEKLSILITFFPDKKEMDREIFGHYTCSHDDSRDVESFRPPTHTLADSLITDGGEEITDIEGVLLEEADHDRYFHHQGKVYVDARETPAHKPGTSKQTKYIEETEKLTQYITIAITGPDSNVLLRKYEGVYLTNDFGEVLVDDMNHPQLASVKDKCYTVGVGLDPSTTLSPEGERILDEDDGKLLAQYWDQYGHTDDGQLFVDLDGKPFPSEDGIC